MAGHDRPEDVATLARLRRPMDPVAVATALARPGEWLITHVATTGSTNDDLVREAAAAGRVLITEEQTAGRGRSGRRWTCPAGAGLMFSVKVASAGIPPGRRGWVGAALGLAVTRAFAQFAGLEATLKWPNDVLVGGLKCGGILAEMTTDGVVVGAGLNISLLRRELPRPDATSLLLGGAGEVDRNALLAEVLDHLGVVLERWSSAGGDVDAGGLRPAYLEACSTLGSKVRIELPGGGAVTGTAVDVDADGAIVIEGPDGPRRFSAGDVVHLRAQP